MAAAPAQLGRPWIKAHAIGGVINIAVTFLAFLVGRVLGVANPGADAALQVAYVAFATVALTFAVTLLGYLAGVVLRSRLPAFPMRYWLTLYALLGGAFGLVSALAWLTPELPPDPEPPEPGLVATLAVGGAVAGAVVGAAVGSLQALVLRSVAQGMGRWIACSTLAGTLFALIVPAIVYGPQSGFASELIIEGLTLIIVVLAAVLMLPAVNRLVPRVG